MTTTFSGHAKYASKSLVVSAAIALLALSGCGLGPQGTVTSAAPVGATIAGHLNGGEQPISGAKITIYATQPNGVATNGVYAGTATVIDSTTTLGDGSFLFTDSPTCSAPDQVYFVASGGNAGSNSTNNNILLMAAVGSCANLNTSLFVDIDEVTTVAAAYALSGFTTITGATVNVASSATNYAGTLNSSSMVYSGTPTNAAGLAHAFLNANSLANYSSGVANTSVPGNSASVVPSAVINALADVLQVCVNSSGGSATGGSTPITPSTPTTATASAGSSFTLTFASATDTAGGSITIEVGAGTKNKLTIPASTTEAGLVTLMQNNSAYSNLTVTATSSTVITVTGPVGTSNTLSTASSGIIEENNDGSTCGRLFGATTIPGGTVPANTLQAVLNLAHAPAINAAGIFSLIPAVQAFTPVIAGAPFDWSIGISYPSGATTGLGQTATITTYGLTLDANDNAYTAALYPAITTATAACLAAFSSNGQLLSGTGWNCSTSAPLVKQLAADQNGYIWVVNGSANPGNVMQQVNASTGVQKATFLPADSPTTHLPQAVAVDKTGNVWFVTAGSNAALDELAYNGTTYANAVVKGVGGTWVNALGIAVDASQNIWGSGSATRFAAVYNPTTAVTTSSTTALTSTEYGISIDKNGLGWVPNGTDTVTPYTYVGGTTPTLTQGGTGVTAATDATLLKNSKYSEVDGNNVLWVAEESTPGLAAYKISTGSTTLTSSMPQAIEPYQGCSATTAVNCQTSGAALYSSASYYLQVDATGSIWITGGKNATSTAGNLLQIIGIAAPSWPLLASGNPGVMP